MRHRMYLLQGIRKCVFRMVLTILLISSLLVAAAMPQPPTFLAHMWKDTQRAFSNGLCLLLFNGYLDKDNTTLRSAPLGRVGLSCPSPCTSSPRGQIRTVAGGDEEVTTSDLWGHLLSWELAAASDLLPFGATTSAPGETEHWAELTHRQLRWWDGQRSVCAGQETK